MLGIRSEVDTLKGPLTELEELLGGVAAGVRGKARYGTDHEREKHAHSILQFQFNVMKETLKLSEELLNVSTGHHRIHVSLGLGMS
ncbi:hypothetical protein CRUP_000616 [Coryphaenoides rupestris]|nr:hypothetical protein CRUP_000616 [Coryphaenoides rupestris]